MTTTGRRLATLLALLALAAFPAEAAGKRYALVVGVNEYRPGQPLPALSYAERDAERLAEVLTTAGYEVTLMTHAAAEKGKRTLAPMADYVRDQLAALLGNPFLDPETDLVLVAFAGHGVYYDRHELDDDGRPVLDDEGRPKRTPHFYFCPADADLRDHSGPGPGDESAFLSRANEVTSRNHLLDLDELYRSLERCKAGGKLLLVDACRNDPSKPRLNRSLNSLTLPPIPDPPGGVAAYFACSKDEEAKEDPKLGHGVFFNFVIEGLGGAADAARPDRPADGAVTLTELAGYVSPEVYDHVRKRFGGARQTPELKGRFRLTIPLLEITRATSSAGWPMFGGSPDRNMVSPQRGISLDFDPEKGTRLKWRAAVGSSCYASPVVAGGRVFVGANNGSAYRPKYPATTDLGTLLCFDEESGRFLWQLSRPKLDAGRVHDWPEQGIVSAPAVEGDRLYVVTNRAELMCLDVQGFHDGENDGVRDEVDTERGDADVVWSLDMIAELGVSPHNKATSSPLVLGDHVYVVSSNGVDESHTNLPKPDAPSFLAVDKSSGRVVWSDNSPGRGVLHGQWSSPAVVTVDGRDQILMPGGDGWLYAFDPAGDGDGGSKLIWRFDLNPKDAIWRLGGRGTRNNVVATPVAVGATVLLAVGQDPEHGDGVGHLYRIDASRTGDTSPNLVVAADGSALPAGSAFDAGRGHRIVANPNSGVLWHVGGSDPAAGDGFAFRRSLSTVAVAEGLVFTADFTGYVHCLDLETGRRHWEYDAFAAIWASPIVADGKVFVGDDDGELVVFEASRGRDGAAIVLREYAFPTAIYGTPTLTNGRLFVADRKTLHVFDVVD